jgi:hypothetical protein
MKFSSSCSTSAAGLYTVDWSDSKFKETEKLELGSGAKVKLLFGTLFTSETYE